MKRLIPFALLIALLAAALVHAEKEKVDAPVGANAVLYLIADSQRDLTRMPSAFTRLSDEEEAKFGEQIARRLLEVRELSANQQKAEALVQATAARLAPFRTRRLPIKAYYYPGEYNAFALPGGYIFIGGDLLAAMKTEDQLAAVIGHEIEHIDRYHCAELMQIEVAMRKIPMSAVARIPIAVFIAGYTKGEELEADREGVRLAAKAGYSAAGALDMFALFAKLESGDSRASTPQGEVAGIALSAVTGYFRSHPLAPERVAQIKTMIAREPSLAAPAQRPLVLPDHGRGDRGWDQQDR